MKLGGPLAGYLRRLLLAQVFGIAIALTALLQMLELLDVTTDILKRKLGVAGVLHYAALRLPSEFTLALPLAMLVGSLFTYYTLARNHELVAIRASGLRLRWVVGMLLPVALGLAVLQFIVSDRVVPVAEASLSNWWAASELPDEDGDGEQKEPNRLWFRTQDGLTAVEHPSVNGRSLQGVTLYLRNEDGQYAGRKTARDAQWIDGAWHLRDVSSLKLFDDHAERTTATDETWQTNLRPSDLNQDSAQLPLSSTALLGVLAGKRVGDRPASYYLTVLYKAYLAPFTLAIMLLLALPATRSVQRGGEGGGMLLLALGTGLGFTLTVGLLGSLGQGGRLPPFFAAIVPLLLFGGLGLSWLHRYDKL